MHHRNAIIICYFATSMYYYNNNQNTLIHYEHRAKYVINQIASNRYANLTNFVSQTDAFEHTNLYM